ncbi:hypothetical protein [Microbulbifer discodermiae]|uniref:hypothetical protein n=1 Tax=Microbulbifer sp. 2201CG32-9 TaxID=3232309 RepID=UPI00345BAD17
MKKFLSLIVLLCACTTVENNESDWQRVMIRGAKMTPDPVLQEVQRLEQSGRVKNVVVLESYPLQIWLSADPETIKKLQALSDKNNPAR